MDLHTNERQNKHTWSNHNKCSFNVYGSS